MPELFIQPFFQDHCRTRKILGQDGDDDLHDGSMEFIWSHHDSHLPSQSP